MIFINTNRFDLLFNSSKENTMDSHDHVEMRELLRAQLDRHQGNDI